MGNPIYHTIHNADDRDAFRKGRLSMHFRAEQRERELCHCIRSTDGNTYMGVIHCRVCGGRVRIRRKRR